MLIEVFGIWLNPKLITCVEIAADYDDDDNEVLSVAIWFNGYHKVIRRKSVKEVIDRINKEVWESNQG